MAIKTTEVDGNKIRYFEEGTSGDTLILLHGLGASAERWESVIPLFAKKFKVIVPDLIGFGYSDKQKCDQYWFVNVMKDMGSAYILGYITRDDFFRKAEFCKAGTNRGNMIYKWDNYVVKAFDLNDPTLIRN